MDTNLCHRCGKNLALVGRVHNCVAVNSTPIAVNSAVNRKRGAYPATNERRAYMREYMRKKRLGSHPGGVS